MLVIGSGVRRLPGRVGLPISCRFWSICLYIAIVFDLSCTSLKGPVRSPTSRTRATRHGVAGSSSSRWPLLIHSSAAPDSDRVRDKTSSHSCHLGCSAVVSRPSAYQAAASTAGSPVRVIGGRAWAASPAAQPDVLARGGSAVNGTPILTPLAACRAGSVSRAVDICAAELLSRVPAWRHLLLAGRQSGRAGSSVPCQALAGRGLAAIHWRSTKYSGSRGGP